MRQRVSDRGQVTIPKALREQLGFREGVEVEFTVEESALRLRKVSARTHPVDRVYGILRSKERTDDYLEEVRGR